MSQKMLDCRWRLPAGAKQVLFNQFVCLLAELNPLTPSTKKMRGWAPSGAITQASELLILESAFRNLLLQSLQSQLVSFEYT